ncbi:hypothetical protein HNQ76_002135 [Thermosulfuriphilus ammonigenes]|nr:hypothetical protein [Thermosulfuriphilus ammonigenes]
MPVFFWVLSSSGKTPIKGDYHNPYSLEDVKRLMNFHGALVARYDGGRWYFLSGRRWYRLDSPFALKECACLSSLEAPSTYRP